MKSQGTILMTGGHVTPAVALAQTLKHRRPLLRLVYVGRPIASEREEVERVGMEFIPFSSGKIHRFFTLSQLMEFPKIIRGSLHAFIILSRFKPRVVVGFGGYLSVPVVLIARFLKIPVVVHEQTVVWGAANRLLKRFASIRAVSWPHLVEPGVVLTGNPIPDEIRAIKRRADGRPVLLILGGSQGSRTIDDAVAPLLPNLVTRFDVYHQTRSNCPLIASPSYHSAPWFSTPDLARVLARTSLVVARSGANTVTNLASLGIPAVLVPLPIAGSDEQMKNAQLLVRIGLAEIVDQRSLTPKTLVSAIDRIVSVDCREAQKKARALVISDAADRLVELVITLVQPRSL